MHEANCTLLCNESWTVLVAAVSGLFVVLCDVLLHKEVRSAAWRNGPLGERQPFNFSTAWAANFTVVGAVLGSILTSSASSGSPAPLLSWHSYQLLSILFAAIIVFAPFAYRKRVRSFLVATALTLMAVIGQAGIAIFITYALARDAGANSNPVLVPDLLVVVLILVASSILVFVWRGIPATIHDYEVYQLEVAKVQGLPENQLHEQLQALLPQHGELQPLVEAFSVHNRLQLPSEPRVRLPT